MSIQDDDDAVKKGIMENVEKEVDGDKKRTEDDEGTYRKDDPGGGGSYTKDDKYGKYLG